MPNTFTSQVHSEPAKHREFRGQFVAHQKFILNSDEYPDTVVCMIVRKMIPRGTTVEELEQLTTRDAAAIEEDLREMAEEYGWLR